MPIIQWPKLGYRGGTPGFNPAHPAARRNVYSFVGGGSGGGVIMANAPGINLKPTINLTAPSTKLDGRVGPMSYNSAADAGLVKYTGLPTAAFTAVTMAAIARIDVDAGGTQIAMADDAGGNEGAILVLFKVATNTPQIRLGGSIVTPTGGAALTLGVPYFVAFTGTPNAAGSWVVKNLITGRITSGVTSTFPATFTAGNGTLCIANSSSTFAGLCGGVAAGMRSNSALTLQQLLAWANDPWEFWYPTDTLFTQALATVSTAITGTLAATEALDTAAFAGSVVVSGSLATTEAIDAAAFAGSVVVSGTLAATEALDAASFAGSVVVSGTLAATDIKDVAAFAGSVVVSGTLAATEATDVAAFAGSTLSGTLAATEATDAASFAGNVLVSGTLAATEATDVAAFNGGGVVSGSFAVTDPVDTVAFAGSVSSAVSGSFAVTELVDIAAFAGSVSVVVFGTLAANEVGISSTGYSFTQGAAAGFAIGDLSVTGADVAAFSGSVGVSGTLAATEAKDVVALAGTLPGVIAGTLAANEAGISSTGYSFAQNDVINTVIGTLSVVGVDVAAFTGTNIGVAGTLAATESPDIALFSSVSLPINNGVLAATEAKDTAAFNGAVAGISGTLAATDAIDIAAFNGTPVIAAQLAATDAPDIAAFNGQLFPLPEITGVLDATEATDIVAFFGGIAVEEAPADFENWKFGRRFDRSLTSRFPWQPGM